MASLSLQQPIPALIDRTRSGATSRQTTRAAGANQPAIVLSQRRTALHARNSEQASDSADFFSVNEASFCL
jgi:hypothetical protein